MAELRHHWRSFGGGEVTPEFWGRIDDGKYQTGLALCRNFLVQPHGPIQNRPGTKFVRYARYSGAPSRLIPFKYAFDQQLVIEFAVGAFRFHALGQTIMDGGVPYEVSHPYTSAELFGITYAQSGDVIRIRHKNHPRRTLRRLSATNWTLTEDPIGPGITPPANVAGTPTPGDTPGTPFDTDYVVTAMTAGGDESLPSAVVTVSNNLYDDGAYNTLTWDAHADAERYNVYKRSAGLFGFIGQTDQLTWKDDNIAPNIGVTPPLDIQLFDSFGNYPGAVSYHDQRLFEAATLEQPQNIWGSKTGADFNFNFSIPSLDTDSLQFKIAARENNSIIHLVAMGDLLAMTLGEIWRVGEPGQPLTPLTLGARQQTFIGAAPPRPVLLGNNMVYAASRGGHLRELGYDGDSGNYLSGDLSVRAPHLFDEPLRVVSLDASVAPFPCVWSVASDGRLIGLTYVPEQQVGAFHQHETAGRFEDVCVITENGRDVAYFCVTRRLGGATQRCIEHFERRDYTAAEDQYFVDCGATYRGALSDTISGLDWLDGETVSILADGGVMAPRVVTGGSITLDEPASVVHIGLPFTSDAETLPLAVELAGYGQGQPKNVSQVFLRVNASSGIFAGPTFDELIEAKLRSTEPMGSPTSRQTGVVDIVIPSAWTEDGQVCIRQSDPLALTLLSLSVEFTIGGG